MENNLCLVMHILFEYQYIPQHFLCLSMTSKKLRDTIYALYLDTQWCVLIDGIPTRRKLQKNINRYMYYLWNKGYNLPNTCTLFTLGKLHGDKCVAICDSEYHAHEFEFWSNVEIQYSIFNCTYTLPIHDLNTIDIYKIYKYRLDLLCRRGSVYYL